MTTPPKIDNSTKEEKMVLHGNPWTYTSFMNYLVALPPDEASCTYSQYQLWKHPWFLSKAFHKNILVTCC